MFYVVRMLWFWGVLLSGFLTLWMALVNGFAGCFVCNVIMLVKIILYKWIYVRESALAEGDVRDKKYKNLSLLFANIITL